MKPNLYYSLNKNERALQILCYYNHSAIILSYMNLRHVSWNGDIIRMEFGSAVIIFKPTTTFDIKEFLEGIREQWVFELRNDGDLEIGVYLSEIEIEIDLKN